MLGPMRKVVLFLTALIVVTLGVVIALRHDLQRERARADALAERVAVLEPVERPSSAMSTTAKNSSNRETAPGPLDLAVEHGPVRPTPMDVAEQPTPKKIYRGSSHAREQVEHLQAALADGTPLQEYQIQALISAIDQVRGEIENAKKERSAQAVTKSETNERLVQAAADILFESQLEKFIELLNRES